MIAVAAVVELVDVEGYALALARQLVACTIAVPVIPIALQLDALSAARGAHTGLPSAEWFTFSPMLARGDGGWSGPYVTCLPGEGPRAS